MRIQTLVVCGYGVESSGNLAHGVEGDGGWVDQAHVLQSKKNIGGHVELLVSLLILLDG